MQVWQQTGGQSSRGPRGDPGRGSGPRGDPGRGRQEKVPSAGHQLKVGNLVVTRLPPDAVGEQATDSNYGYVEGVSKQLSFMLRGHKGSPLVIEASGLVPLVDVLPRLSNRGKVGVYEIGSAIQSMDKIRFGLYAGPDGAPLYIRADHGHSGGVVEPGEAHGRPLSAEEVRAFPCL